MVKEIRLEFTKLKPVKVTLDGNRSMTVKEAIFALAPTLERMKKRGFDTQEIAEKLHEKGIEVKPPTLAKYLNEFRRGKDRKKDTPTPPLRIEKAAPISQPEKPARASTGQFAIRPDTPLEDL
ncbi:protein MobC [uncultured Desulfovibrio sp.]|uniref:protein MobC n=1 Tax=uncultured Desulfovibrio sp. TaxID=167968 RepID=UPI002672BCA4|nr:protein MobC [uncultured Desulfovibrio sp.]